MYKIFAIMVFAALPVAASAYDYNTGNSSRTNTMPYNPGYKSEQEYVDHRRGKLRYNTGQRYYSN